jgi:hypothetical protein
VPDLIAGLRDLDARIDELRSTDAASDGDLPVMMPVMESRTEPSRRRRNGRGRAAA